MRDLSFTPASLPFLSLFLLSTYHLSLLSSYPEAFFFPLVCVLGLQDVSHGLAWAQAIRWLGLQEAPTAWSRDGLGSPARAEALELWT